MRTGGVRDAWLDRRQARILSRDLLGDRPLRFGQRTHHPPVDRIWPFEPPTHALWIEPHENTAVLMVVPFGQVLGAVPVNDLPAASDRSAWSFDPRKRSYFPSSYPAIWLGTAAARASQAGATPVMIDHPEHPFVFLPDGPDGPIDFGMQMEGADSPAHALEVVKRLNAAA